MSETQAATVATGFRDWDEVVDKSDQQPAGDQDSLFLRLKARPEPYKFRIVVKPLSFRRHWNAFRSLRKEDGKPVGAVVSPASRVEDIKLDVAWAEGDYKPDIKYAALVVNRDNARFNIIEAGPGVFKAIIDYQKETKQPIFGDVAPDWLVRVKKVRGQNGEKTEYSVVSLPPSTLTEEEKNKLANFTAKVDWRRFFTPATPEQIAALYARLEPGLKKNPQARKRNDASAPPTAPAAAAPAPSAPAASTASVAPAAPATPVKTAEKSPTVAAAPEDTSWATGDTPADGAQF